MHFNLPMTWPGSLDVDPGLQGSQRNHVAFLLRLSVDSAVGRGYNPTTRNVFKAGSIQSHIGAAYNF